MAPLAEVASTGKGPRLWWLLVLAAALLPALGTLDAGLISDDGAALGYVHRHGLASDWLTSQYDLRTVRFWRPLVTSTLALQERLTGVDPAPLRLFNLGCHAAMAVLAGLLALRLGGGRIGALLAGLLAAFFPHQGGTVTWIVGRVDSLCAPLILGACLCALDGKRLASFALAFLALATKEIAFVTPLWVMLLDWGRGSDAKRTLRSSLPCWAALALALAWRRLAIGAWIGGYPNEPVVLADLPRAATALARDLWPVLLLGAAFLGFQPRREPSVRRAWAAGLLSAIAASALLFHVLRAGRVPNEHLRTLLVPWLALSIAAGSWFGIRWREASGARAKALPCSMLLLLSLYFGWSALKDCRVWAEAGREAESLVQHARAALAQEPKSPVPVLMGPIIPPPRLDSEQRAYVLHWGVADRFREPFPVAARPVWPWRPVFEGPHTERDSRRDLGPDGLVRPELPPTSGEFAIRLVDRAREVDELSVDERLWIPDDPTAPREEPPYVELAPQKDPDCRLEVLLITELGYQAAQIERLRPPDEQAALRVGLREILLGGQGLALWQVLDLAADLGATTAYLELRWIVRENRNAYPLPGVSPWIRLRWTPGLRDRLRPR